MNINRNNYEEYFLLYADKELTAEEKNMVDMFIQQNPDLEEEFIMLQQSVLKPDNTIEIKNKSLLFREDAFINQSNFEEKFLLYADNELSLSEIEKTEKFVLGNSLMQNQFSVLQQVKYKPDTSIVLADKTFLYKKEGDTKIIPFRWKAMAAAVLLGTGLWAGITYWKQNISDKEIVTKQITIPKKNTVTPIKPKDAAQGIPLVKNVGNQKASFRQVVQNKFVNSIKTQVQPQQTANVKGVHEPDHELQVNKKESEKKTEIAINDLSAKNEIINPTKEPKLNNITSETSNKTDDRVSTVKDKYAQPASYIADSEIKSENYVFYNITTEEFNKSKIGTFFKKVKRAVERKILLKNDRFKIGTAAITKDDQN